MSTGHEPSDWTYADRARVERALKNEAVASHMQRFAREDTAHDLPYLGGYSKDGTTIYIDRHLPEELTADLGNGTKKLFRPRRFIRLHEEVEKALTDALGWQYGPAHQVANGAERREVLEAGLPWDAYRKAINPFIKADEVEKLGTVPPDLDMTPYLFPPVNRTLIKRMRAAMGERKLDKTDTKVNYSDDRGYPGRHCGPDSDWPKNYCTYYGDHDCSEVAGYICAKGGCDLYQKAES